MAATPPAGFRRSQCGQRRDLWVSVRLTPKEKAALAEAADRAGMAVSAYLGQAGMEAAEGRGTTPAQARALLAELIRAGGLIQRAGTDLNRAVGRLTETGAAGPDLGPAAGYLARVARDVDEAALKISRRLL
jgi:hypothetical protein